MPDWDAALRTLHELEQLVLDKGGGFDDEATVRRFRQVVRQVMAAAGDVPQLAEICSRLMGWVEILFSPRRWAQYDTPERVRAFVLIDLNRLQTVVAAARSWSRPFRLALVSYQVLEEISAVQALRFDDYNALTSHHGHSVGLYVRDDRAAEWSMYVGAHPDQTSVFAMLLARAVVDMAECAAAARALVGVFNVAGTLGVFSGGDCGDRIQHFPIDHTPLERSWAKAVDGSEADLEFKTWLDELGSALHAAIPAVSYGNSTAGNWLNLVRCKPEEPLLVGDRELRGRVMEMANGQMIWWAGRTLA